VAIMVAAVTAFAISSVWYVVFRSQLPSTDGGDRPPASGDRPPAWKLIVEFARCLVVTTVLAGLVAEIGIADLTSALLLAIVVWLGFPVTLLLGSVIWEGVPPRLALVHAGDWLVKTAAIAVILERWP
jgi:hypothetical protein